MTLFKELIWKNRAFRVRSLVFLHDLLVAGLAYLAAVAIRYGTLTISWEQHWVNAALIMAISAVVSWWAGINRGVWRYASLLELMAITKYAAITVLIFSFAGFLLSRLDATPRATLLLTFVFIVILTSATRISYRILRSRRAIARAARGPQRNALLIGAGDNTELLLKAARDQSNFAYLPVGLIDDRKRRVGLSIQGVKVVADVDGMDRAIERLNKQLETPIAALILTQPRDRIADEAFERLIEVASNRGLQLLRVPDLSRLPSINGEQSITPKPIRFEDLLSRTPKYLDSSALIELTRNATVLITGAGGSIGSELCRQILTLKPRRLILVDNSEYLLFTIDQELRPKAKGTIVSARLGDVRNRKRITRLIQETRPQLVLHAAALKHVPIVEEQPLEGLLTNVLGTRNIADACMEFGVQAMIMVSTDKAVNPTSVMGASKRLAEMYCQALDLEGAARYVTVRFGNVLGSAGSVVPIFERQIAEGGPVTVTHPDIERFFMTIPEAVSLILHATGHAMHHEKERGRIFVLDMGQPVKIADMARKLIQLSGLRPNIDIKIVYTGLRAGEKLYEELFNESEELLETTLPSVKQAKPAAPCLEIITAKIDELQAAIEHNDAAAALRILLDARCSYQPRPETIAQLRQDKCQMH